jgi:Glycosyl hydrolase 108
MLENREKSLKFVFEDEGGLVIRPDLGRSNMGISFHTMAYYRKLHKMRPPSYQDHAKLTKEEATNIYFELFFDPCHFDELKSGIDYAVVDMCINLGVGGAADALEAKFSLPHTHKFNPEKITYFNNYIDVATCIVDIRDAWIDLKRKAPLYKLRGPGWMARDLRVRERALKLAGM